MKYYIDYEIETALGDHIIHRYVGNKEQVIKAIKIAKANNYRIIKVDRIEE